VSDRVIAAALGAIVLLARIAFASQTLWAWDSVLYARALEQGFHVGVDLGDQRPQPPGYVFYVAAASLARLVTRDSNAALVLVSVIGSSLTVAAVYVACRRFASRPLALVCALGAATAPLAWTYGEVAMPYALLGLLSIVLALSLREARRGSWPAAVVASAALGLAAGFRQDLLLLLGPLWLWMLAARSWRERGLCVAALGLAALAWFAPSAAFSGGPAAYLASLGGQATRVSELSPAGGGDALLRNVLLTVFALWWGLLGFALLLIAAIVASFRARLRVSGDAGFFALWLVPAAFVYVTIHIGDPGYLMSVLPGLYVACAALLADAAPGARHAIVAVGAALFALNAGVFVLTDAPFSAVAIARHDRSLVERVAYVRGSFDRNAVVIAQSEYLTARYYLGEFRVLFYGDAPEVLSRSRREERLVGPATVVVFGALAGGRPPALRISNEGMPVPAGTVDPSGTIVAYDLEPR